MYRAHMDGRQRTARQAYGTVLVLALLAVAAVQSGALGFLVASFPGSRGAPGAGLLPPRLPRSASPSEQRGESEPASAAAPAGALASCAALALLAAALAPRRGRGGSFTARLRGAVGRVARRQGPNPPTPSGGSKLTVEEMKEILRARGETMAASMLEKLEAEVLEDGKQVVEEPPKNGEVLVRDAEAEAMFAELQQLDSSALKEDYFDSSEGVWDKEGLQDDLSSTKQKTEPAPKEVETVPEEAEAAPEAAVEEKAPAQRKEAEEMLAQLQQVEGGGVEKEDYFDPTTNTWDLEGLQEDLSLAQKQQAAPAQESTATPAAPSNGGQNAEAMFAQLKQLDSGAEKEDYFDFGSGEWDMEGLKDDLTLAQQTTGSAPEEVKEVPQAPPQAETPSQNQEAEQMLAQLQKLDPGTEREDYYDSDSGEWDMTGLKEDLKLSQEQSQQQPPPPQQQQQQQPSTPAVESPKAAAAGAEAGESPQSMLEELMRYDPGVSKEDYYSEEAEEWDIDGLRDDLELASKSSGSSPAKEPEAAPAPVPAAAPAPVPAAASEAGESEAPALYAELAELDGEVSQEDYFDEESGTWDLQGLQDDLALARQAQGGGGEATAAPEAQAAPVQQEEEGSLEDPEALLAHLSTFDPQVTKQDYYADGEWDVEGLKEDLRLAKEAVVASVQAQESPAEAPAAAAPAAPVQAAAEPAEAEAEEAITAGDYVLGKYEGDGAGWYTAVVTKDQGGGSFSLKWDEDSTEETVSRDKIKLLPPITVNAKVTAVWEEDKGWYDAVVLRAGDAGTWVVKYDEDSSEASLPKEKIRMKVEPPTEPQYWAAPYEEGDTAPEPGEEIEACWRDGDYAGYHTAKMVKDNGDGTYLVKWDEDDSQTSVKKEEIRKYKVKFPLSNLLPGQKYTGIVTNVIQVGAFVNIGVDAQSDGFVHISRISAARVENAEDVASVGQVVTVWVSRIKDDGKYDLSMVEGRVDGGARAQADYSAFLNVDQNTLLKGTVVGLQAYGIFLNVEPPDGSPAQRGFVHCSEIRDGYVTDAAEEAEVGQEVQVRVVEVDKDRNTLRLSMKPA